jgi:Zn ribbon nucleic-acid-binding protein
MGFIIGRYCPRCSGRMYRSEDVHGVYDTCLQCGYTSDVAKVLVSPSLEHVDVISIDKPAGYGIIR